jgi:hypothetical protein
MRDPLPPSFFRLIRQNSFNADCTVAALAMMFSVSYEESLAACLLVAPEVLDKGMVWNRVKQAAEALGGELKLLPPGKYDVEDATGLLIVENRKEAHAVYLWAGRIMEGNGEGWLEPEDYFKHYKWKPRALYVRVS